MSEPTEQQIKGKALQDRYEAETGGVAVVAVVSHGELAYASWGYQTWLEQQAAPPPQAGADNDMYCENHPEELFGHDGCDGAGIPKQAQMFMLVIQRRNALQEAKELRAYYDPMVSGLLKRIEELEGQAGAENAEQLFDSFTTEETDDEDETLYRIDSNEFIVAIESYARHIAAKAVEDRDKELTRLVDEALLDAGTVNDQGVNAGGIALGLLLVKSWLNPQIETT